MSIEKPIVEEAEIVCDDCGKLLGVTQWKVDYSNTQCPTCGEECDGSELKYVCIQCRGQST